MIVEEAVKLLNMNGMIYLVQPKSDLGTDLFKIGMSRKNTTQRINQYGRETQIICTRECSNPNEVEIKLIHLFNSNFTLAKGREYFTGNKSKMIDIFNQCVNDNILTELNSKFDIDQWVVNDIINKDLDFMNYCSSFDIQGNIDCKCLKSNNGNIYQQLCNSCKSIISQMILTNACGCDYCDYLYDTANQIKDKISDIEDEFPNYYEDIAFGGPKKLIKIINTDLSRIETCTIDNTYDIEYQMREADDRTSYTPSCKYINLIINLRLIQMGEIYDINDKLWISQFNTYRSKVKIHEFDDLSNIIEPIDLICADCIINNTIYGYANSSGICFLYMQDYHRGMFYKEKYLRACIIGKKLYNRDYVKQYFPYLVSINTNDNTYQMVNRDYNLIIDINFDQTKWGGKETKSIYLTDADNDDYRMPWHISTKKEYSKYIKRVRSQFEKATAGLICISECKHSFKLLYEC